jgi:hypothetical protein
MTRFLKFAFLLAVALVPVSFTGCGSSSEPTVVEVEPMTEEAQAEYEAETMGDSSDTSQN